LIGEHGYALGLGVVAERTQQRDYAYQTLRDEDVRVPIYTLNRLLIELLLIADECVRVLGY
jgi:hypothetical protein